MNELSTTPDHTHGEHCFTITHPFRDQTFLLLSQRFAWGEERVFFANPQTQQVRSLPLAWTNLALPDPFVVVAAGKAVLRFSDVQQLTQVSDIRTSNWRIEYVASDVTYHFLVEGCAEERFFDLTLHSSCTSWSPEEILTTIPSAVERKYGEMEQEYRKNHNQDWGKPISLEEFDGGGWYHQDYDNGASIYWNKDIGTAVIYGFIAQEWGRQERGAGPLGYPITDEHDWPSHPGGRITCFQQGTITWSPQNKDHATVNMHATCV